MRRCPFSPVFRVRTLVALYHLVVWYHKLVKRSVEMTGGCIFHHARRYKLLRSPVSHNQEMWVPGCSWSWSRISYNSNNNLGLYSLSGKTSYRKISWSLEAARFGFKLFQSLWNLAGTSAALLPRCLSNFRAIRPLQHPISRLRDFTRFGGKTSYRLVNRGPVCKYQWYAYSWLR